MDPGLELGLGSWVQSKERTGTSGDIFWITNRIGRGILSWRGFGAPGCLRGQDDGTGWVSQVLPVHVKGRKW